MFDLLLPIMLSVLLPILLPVLLPVQLAVFGSFVLCFSNKKTFAIFPFLFFVNQRGQLFCDLQLGENGP